MGYNATTIPACGIFDINSKDLNENQGGFTYIMKKSMHTDMYLCISINLLKLCKYFKLYHELVVEYDKNLKLNLRTTL